VHNECCWDERGMRGIETVDKGALAEQFSAAAGHYEQWATAQAEIAARLVRHIPAHAAPALIVDLGCGTGLLSAHLLRCYPGASLIGIDLAEGMVEHCRRNFNTEASAAFGADSQTAAIAPTSQNVQFVCGDVEDRAMLVPDAGLIASSCVAQWFSDSPATLRMWSHVLAPGGMVAFACLLQGSFRELEEAYYDAVQCSFQGLSLPDAECLPRLFAGCGLRVSACVEDSVSARYSSSRAALRSFQEIGADFHGQPGHSSLGPAALRRLLAAYDRFAGEQGMVPVTYRVQYVVAERGR